MAEAPTNLKELYTADLRDLWSANEQMQKIVQSFNEEATDPKIKKLFEQSAIDIDQHTKQLREMMSEDTNSICSGMEGLVQEATQHALKSDLMPQLRDLEMIAQYQRMSHYGIAGFGTVAAYAGALGMTEEATKLKSIVASIYKGDEYSSSLAETAQKTVVQA